LIELCPNIVGSGFFETQIVKSLLLLWQHAAGSNPI